MLLTACKPPQDRYATQSSGHLVISAEFPDAPTVGPAPLTVTVTDKGGQGVEGATVKVEGNMTHAGMVPVLVDAQEVGDGVYRASAMHFTMAGDWLITITVTAAGERSSAAMPVAVGR